MSTLMKFLNYMKKNLMRAYLSRAEGKNYKGRLQEHLMKLKKELPKYTDVEIENGEFLSTVTVDHKIIGRAINKSKKLSQTNAAKSALEYLTQ